MGCLGLEGVRSITLSAPALHEGLKEVNANSSREEAAAQGRLHDRASAVTLSVPGHENAKEMLVVMRILMTKRRMSL